MSDQKNIKFGTDLITFYNPGFWGVTDGSTKLMDLISSGKWDPLRFWERILDSSQEAGLDGVEITFPPGDWHSAQEAYGSSQSFAGALRDRGLELAGGFFGTYLAKQGRRVNFTDPDDHDLILDVTAGYAEFLNTCGAEVLVAALPMRKSRDQDPAEFADLRMAEPVADILNRMGATAMKSGVRLALHPEAFSAFRNSRDVDLFMMLTDPTYVFLCPDTAQFTVAGSDPIRIVERHRDRVVLTHWKDAVGPAPADTIIDDTIFTRQAQWFAGVGEGVVDWPSWMRLLRDMRYKGWAVFELDFAADPIAELKRNRRYVESTLSQIYQ